MNYHLMQDDKFINDFISDVEKLASGKNRYFILTSSERLTHIRHQEVICNPNLPEFFINIVIPHLQLGDAVYIHCLESRYYSVVSALPPFIKLGIFFWGGEFVEFPEDVYAKRLLERKTYWFYLRHLHPIPTYLRPYKNPLNSIKHFFRKIDFEQEKRQLNSEKFKALSRVDFFFHWNIKDYIWLREQCKDFKAQFVFHFYSGGLYTELVRSNRKQNDTLTFWLGNSATMANNHLDALSALLRFSKLSIKIICTLSYGESISSKYTSTILKIGKRKYGNKFCPLTGFLERDAYYGLFANSDVLLMYHNRTQGAANVFAGLLAGKKIFMQPKSTLYQLLIQHGVEVYSTADLKSFTFEQLKTPLPQTILEKNKALVKNDILNNKLKEKELQKWFS
jgi:hypothetical protein